MKLHWGIFEFNHLLRRVIQAYKVKLEQLLFFVIKDIIIIYLDWGVILYMPKKKNFETSAILKEVYPIIEQAMNKNLMRWKKCMSSFMQKRSALLFDNMPCDRIYYNDTDRKELYDALGISPEVVKNGIRHTYYFPMSKFKPQAAKDDTTITVMCIVRYFLLKKDQKSLELAMIYQAFSGKYYPSIHYGMFPLASPSKYRHIMEYVVNHKLTQKYELKVTGSVIGVIKSIDDVWCKSYAYMLKSFDDEDITYMIQQLHNRIKSFLKNIAALYYEAYDNKEFITYDKDSLPEEEGSSTAYHLADNDSFRLQKYVENTMQKVNTSQVDYKICKMASDANVRVEEVRSIFEAILNDRDNIPIIKEFITNLIATYMRKSEGNKDVATISFFKYATQAKPNSKDPLILRMGEIIETVLNDVSVSYRKRKHRLATKASYQKMFYTYFAVMIINANKS